jgi:hypothetical protein
MSILIAGSPVALGDSLYSRRAGAVGTVIQVLDHSFVLRINKAGSNRDLTVQAGGVVAGQRDVYWHEPLALDLPKGQGAKLQKLQQLLNTLNEVL